MAHSLSAKKRVRQTEKRRARNRARKTLIRDVVKDYTTALTAGDVAKATELLPKVVSRLDKVAATSTLHKKTASRKRSRLAKKLNVLKANNGVVAKAAGKGGAKKGAGTKAAKA